MIFLQPDPIHMNSPSPLSDAFWSDLLKALRAQQCVLFLGPDALPDLPLFEALCRYLGGDLTADPPRPPEDVLAVYPNEELFLFANTGDRAALSFRLDDFYREQEKRLAPVYRQIAALPLPLVVSLLPDEGLHRSFDDEGVQHQFVCYNFRGRAAGELRPPKQRRMVFNLFGNVNEADSLVLDHDDLFGFIAEFLGSRKLSDTHVVVQDMLGSGSSVFLFVGFQFDKWYMQLLLRALNPAKFKARQYAVNPSAAHSTRVFLSQQFKMTFVDEWQPVDFLAELSRRWQADQSASAAEGGNRPTPAQLRDWLKNAQTERVLEALDAIAQAAADNDLQHQTAMLSARHSRLELSLLKGVISADNAKLEANQINDALLNLLAQLPQP